MQKRRKEGSKLGPQGENLEKYFKTLYKGSYLKATDDTFSRDQSYLQVPLGQAKFLELMVRIKKPQKVLEIGTFRGYSTVFMATYLPKGAKIYTIERDASRYKEIEKLWKDTKVTRKINLIKGQALSALGDLKNSKSKFDLFFIDANKSEAIEYFKVCYNKLSNKGAMIIIDNTLWAGEVIDDEPQSNAARHMKNLNTFIFKNHKKNSYLIPGWDGMTITIHP